MKKMKNSYGLLVALFGLSICFTNCETENDEINQQTQKIKTIIEDQESFKNSPIDSTLPDGFIKIKDTIQIY